MHEKLKLFTKEELKEAYENREFDLDFLFEYLSTRDRVYNKLIDKVNEDFKKIKLLNKQNEELNEKYCNELKRKNKAIEYMNSEEFILLMMSSYNENENYFKAKNNVLEILCDSNEKR